MSYTDEPVIDAEEYCSREDPRPIVGTCEQCGHPVYGRSENYDGDECIEIPGGLIHWDCWNDYGKTLKKEAV